MNASIPMATDAYVRTANPDHAIKLTKEVETGVLIDYDERGGVIGVEVLDVVDVRTYLRTGRGPRGVRRG